jgi:arsenite methyltransferase
MKKAEELKKIVKDKYAEIVTEDSGCGCACGCGPGDNATYSVFSDSYESQKGYVKEADLGLGCGLPTEYADIKSGDAVLDLGSGAGNDCFVARAIVGETGKVTGLDFTDEMITKAEVNNFKMGYKNVEFIKGDIEEMPLPDKSYDVVISNCVINLVPDKEKAFSEIMRVLKPGGHFCISDVVLEGKLPVELQSAAEMYAGCVAGALPKKDYLAVIERAVFKNISVKKEKMIQVPDSMLLEYISEEELHTFKNSGTGIFSITVVGHKPHEN